MNQLSKPNLELRAVRNRSKEFGVYLLRGRGGGLFSLLQVRSLKKRILHNSLKFISIQIHLPRPTSSNGLPKRASRLPGDSADRWTLCSVLLWRLGALEVSC